MLIAGVDEVGRGCIAGPVVASAVILPDNFTVKLADSKKLTPNKRNKLKQIIINKSLAWIVVFAPPRLVDKINILNATMFVMKISLDNLSIKPHKALIDGNKIPSNLAMPAKAIIKGDDKEPVISAASILAKTFRDNYMINMAKKYPNYSFEKHKGYLTKIHHIAIIKYGICPIHRNSFEPIKTIISQNSLI